MAIDITIPADLGHAEPNNDSHDRHPTITVAASGAAGAAASPAANRLLVLANYSALFVGSVSSSLLTRFYFCHGGSSRWLATVVQTAGFPLLLPLFFFSPPPRRQWRITRRQAALSAAVGLMVALNNWCVSWGISYLPVSTSSLLLSTQLAFNLALSVILVGQTLTFVNLNCVILLTLASIVLALNSTTDRPAGVSQQQFFLGIAATIAAALLFALYLPVAELIYRKVEKYHTVVEMQIVMQAAATASAAGFMAAFGGFKELALEATVGFRLGEVKYFLTLAFTVVCWQLCFMGTAGMVFLTTSLNSGICMTALLSFNVVAGVLVFRDNFGGLKAVSTVLCLWGFSSYLYGVYTKMNKKDNAREDEKGKKTMETEVVIGI